MCHVLYRQMARHMNGSRKVYLVCIIEGMLSLKVLAAGELVCIQEMQQCPQLLDAVLQWSACNTWRLSFLCTTRNHGSGKGGRGTSQGIAAQDGNGGARKKISWDDRATEAPQL